jgi:hypothetical protein
MAPQIAIGQRRRATPRSTAAATEIANLAFAYATKPAHAAHADAPMSVRDGERTITSAIGL